jgi:anti-sigma regulatory factor (Ser/Thr protein kinase)
MCPSLNSPPADAEALVYRTELGSVRQFAAAKARQAGLPPDRVRDLVSAVSELAANTLAHTDGPGTLLIWATDDEIICQVHDDGHLTDRHPEQVRPEPDQLGGGRGLWVVRQICDRVETGTTGDGATIRVYMQRPECLGSDRNARRLPEPARSGSGRRPCKRRRQ